MQPWRSPISSNSLWRVKTCALLSDRMSSKTSWRSMPVKKPLPLVAFTNLVRNCATCAVVKPAAAATSCSRCHDSSATSSPYCRTTQQICTRSNASFVLFSSIIFFTCRRSFSLWRAGLKTSYMKLSTSVGSIALPASTLMANVDWTLRAKWSGRPALMRNLSTWPSRTERKIATIPRRSGTVSPIVSKACLSACMSSSGAMA
mmetsp:Transcript_30616/g.84164  ORF Transcript_30616/g.84164 Transcript_30616/m.84164 type:complete len:203 (+) Transcript_30616:210-818(+)